MAAGLDHHAEYLVSFDREFNQEVIAADAIHALEGLSFHRSAAAWHRLAVVGHLLPVASDGYPVGYPTISAIIERGRYTLSCQAGGFR